MTSINHLSRTGVFVAQPVVNPKPTVLPVGVVDLRAERERRAEAREAEQKESAS